MCGRSVVAVPLPGNRVLHVNHFPNGEWRLERYERLVGFVVFLESFLEPWRDMAFASLAQGVQFVEDLIATNRLA